MTEFAVFFLSLVAVVVAINMTVQNSMLRREVRQLRELIALNSNLTSANGEIS